MHGSSVAHHYASLLERLAAALPAASNSPLLLLRLRSVHAHIVASGFSPRAHIINRLIHLYTQLSDLPSALRIFHSSPTADIIARTSLLTAHSNAGNLPLARHLFDETPHGTRDTVFYNAMISAYSRASVGLPAIRIFRDILTSRCELRRPDNYTFTGVLSAAASIPGVCVVDCGQLHCAVVKFGTGLVVSVMNALIALYFKCDEPEAAGCAREVFDDMVEKEEITWTTMVVGYVRRGDLCGARRVLDEMGGRSDIIWNAVWNGMISGYFHHGLFYEAFEMFRRMHSMGILLDEFTYTSILSACAHSGNFNDGKAVHAHIIRSRPDFDP